MLSRSRTAVRSAVAGALVASPLIAVAAATPAAADVPIGWEEGTPMSTLDVLLVFAGIPLAIAVVLALFGLILARRTTPSYLPYVAAPGAALTSPAERAELTSGH
ncbi:MULTISPECIES: hypothetical protein [Mumia]|uniref:hypothetical protein n=1 Tax=Mumia TaxID=1546255 RepID=UPI001424041E|nr:MULTISPECIES: hypothetical protein [unclassified Mumia]QMW65229.1 hypothetical protein H4N58_13540 [Mumia sp. ZJ1417]